MRVAGVCISLQVGGNHRHLESHVAVSTPITALTRLWRGQISHVMFIRVFSLDATPGETIMLHHRDRYKDLPGRPRDGTAASRFGAWTSQIVIRGVLIDW